jgi:hypothetical protein
MLFSVNETAFPSVAHQSIWNAARLIFPLEKSLAVLEDKSVIAACADLHNMVMDGYADIFNHPMEYGIDPIDVEAYLRGRSWSKAIILAINKEDNGAIVYFKRIESRINFFRFICNRISSTCTISPLLSHEEGVRFSKDEYKKLLSTVKTKTGYGKDKFIILMERLSFMVTPVGDDHVITNIKYPRLFEALRLLNGVDLKHKESKTRGLGEACRYLDFRVLKPGYVCSFEDALYSLDDANKKEIIRLDALLSSWGVTRVCKLNTVDWMYKQKIIAAYNGRKEHFDCNKAGNENRLITVFISKTWSFHWPNIRPNFGPEKNTEHRIAFEHAVERLPNADAMKDFCIKHFKRCRECGCLFAPPPRGHPKVMFDKIFYSCGGGTSFGVEHLTFEKFNFVADLIKISMELL